MEVPIITIDAYSLNYAQQNLLHYVTDICYFYSLLRTMKLCTHAINLTMSHDPLLFIVSMWLRSFWHCLTLWTGGPRMLSLK